MDIVAGSQNDEFYTPEYAVRPILKYLKPRSTIWCPFDTQESNFVRMLDREGHKVIHSHKNVIVPLNVTQHSMVDGDFFYAPEVDCDYIISNPPYSLKNEVFEKLFSLGKPFAMLVGVVGLFESQKRFEMFRNNQFEIMYLNRRVAYFKDFSEQKPSLNPPFSSVYLCKDILPKQIIFEEIQK